MAIRILLVLLILAIGNSQSIQKWHKAILNKHKATAAPPSGKDFTDDFNRANANPPGVPWTVLNGTVSITDNILVGGTQSTAVFDTACDGVTQYVCGLWAAGANQGGPVFRYTGTEADGYYLLNYYSGTWYWEEWDDGGWNYDIGSSATPDVAVSNYFGITIQGTGDDTIISLWGLGETPASTIPYDKNNWESSSDAADATITANPGTHKHDTGKQIGMGGYAAWQCNTWWGGDTE